MNVKDLEKMDKETGFENTDCGKSGGGTVSAGGESAGEETCDAGNPGESGYSDNAGKVRLKEELEQRLKWYQGRRTEEELDTQEIEMILNLLQLMDPLPETEDEGETERAERAYARFEQNYQLKARKRGVLRRNKVLRYAVLTAAAVLVLFAVLNIGTYASVGVDFFTFLWQGGGGRSFVAIGEDVEGMDSMETDMTLGCNVNERQEYEAWEELPEEILGQIIAPTEMPEGMELENVYCWNSKYIFTIKAYYVDEASKTRIQIWIEKYEEVPTWQKSTNEESVFVREKEINGEDCSFYKNDKDSIVYFLRGSQLYTVWGNCSVDDIERVVSSMTKW